jgi:hypothetical protein
MLSGNLWVAREQRELEDSRTSPQTIAHWNRGKWQQPCSMLPTFCNISRRFLAGEIEESLQNSPHLYFARRGRSRLVYSFF